MWSEEEIREYPVEKMAPNFKRELPFPYSRKDERTPLTETDLGNPETLHGKSTITVQVKKLVDHVKKYELTPQRFLALSISVRDSWHWKSFRDLDEEPGNNPRVPAERYGYDLERYLDACRALFGSQTGPRDFTEALKDVIYPLQREGLLEKVETENREYPLNRVTPKGRNVVANIAFKEFSQTKLPHKEIQVEATVLGAELGCLVWIVHHGIHEAKETEPDVIWVPPLNAYKWDWNRMLWIEAEPDPKQHNQKVKRQTISNLKEGWRFLWTTGDSEKLVKIGELVDQIKKPLTVKVGWDKLDKKTDVILQPLLCFVKSGRETRSREKKEEKVREKVKKALRANWSIYPKEPHKIWVGTELRARQKLAKGKYKTHYLGRIQDYGTVELARGEITPDQLEEREKQAKKDEEIRRFLDQARNPTIRIDSNWIWTNGERKWRATEENRKTVREAV